MKFSCTTFFLLVVITQSCVDSSRHTPINTEQGPGKISKSPSSFNDTLIIDSPSAVFYFPDSLQLEKIKGTMKKDVFESEEHSFYYQMRNAHNVLKKYWPKIRVVETSESRFLLFIKKDKKRTLIDLNSKGDMCGLFLFDGKKEPELADMMNIDTALGFYFTR